MSYSTDILAHDPFVFWETEETSGTSAADSSGDGATGTYTNSPTLDQASLVPNEPDARSIDLNGVNQYIGCNPISITTGSAVSMGCVVRPDVLAGSRDEMIGILGAFQIWVGFFGDGLATLWASQGGSNYDATTVVQLAADTTVDVVAVYNNVTMKLYIDGVERATRNLSGVLNNGTAFYAGHSSTDFSANTFFNGRMHKIWAALKALSPAEVLALHDSRLAIPNDPPTVPGAFVHPLADEVFDTSLTVEVGASTDPEEQAVQYRFEYSETDGSTWNLLADWQSSPSYIWDTAEVDPNELMKVRVRARDDLLQMSDWLTSDTFTINHVSTPPQITLTVERRTDRGCFVVVDYSDPDIGELGAHYATQYEVYLGEELKVDTGWDTAFKTEKWFTGFPKNTELLIRARARDAGGQIGNWTPLVGFRTRRVSDLDGGAGFNQFRNEGNSTGADTIVATYGELIFGIGFTVLYPDFVIAEPGSSRVERGVRIRWASMAGDYVQPVGPGGVQNVIRYGGAALDPAGDFSLVLVFKPEYFDPSAKSVILGGEHWWLYRDNGSVKLRTVNDAVTTVSEPFLTVGGLLNYQDNVLIITYRREVLDPACMLDVPPADRITTPGTLTFWLNGTTAQIGTLYGGGPFPTELIAGCAGASTAYKSIGCSFARGIAPHNYIWLATQSSDGARDVNSSNYYGYAGMFREFAWMPEILLDADDAVEMRTAYNTGSVDGLAAEILSRGAVVYDRFWQPRPPEVPVVTVV